MRALKWVSKATQRSGMKYHGYFILPGVRATLLWSCMRNKEMWKFHVLRGQNDRVVNHEGR